MLLIKETRDWAIFHHQEYYSTRAASLRKSWTMTLRRDKIMKPRDFFDRFTVTCKQHLLEPQTVFRHLPFDELDWLQNESKGAWDCLELCLKDWSSILFNWQEVHKTAYPELSCQTCRHYTSGSRWCGQWNKAIPKTFNIKNGCKDWNL